MVRSIIFIVITSIILVIIIILIILLKNIYNWHQSILVPLRVSTTFL